MAGVAEQLNVSVTRSSSSSSHASSEGSGWDSPLMAEFQPAENVYSFMILYPEVNRIRHGSYWNPNVYMAFMLFALCVVTQITLTHLTGKAIMTLNLAYRKSLLKDEGPFDRIIFGADVVDGVDGAAGDVAHASEGVVDDTGVHMQTLEHGCCRGLECSDLVDPVCCAPGVPSGTPVEDHEKKDIDVLMGLADFLHRIVGVLPTATSFMQPKSIASSRDIAADGRAMRGSHSGSNMTGHSRLSPRDGGGPGSRDAPRAARHLAQERGNTSSHPAAASIGRDHQSRLRARRNRDGKSSGLAGGGAEDDVPLGLLARRSEVPHSSGLGSSTEADGATAKRSATCYKKDGVLDCTPPTFSFMERWSDLDTNGDGNWTHEEALRDDANLACALRTTGLTPETVFRTMSKGIVTFLDQGLFARDTIPVPLEIHTQKGIPKPYFDFWRGTVTLCSANDANRCGHLLVSALFDKELGHSFRNLDHALGFCTTLLKSGGVCDSVMPVTYSMYREQASEKCGGTHVTHGVSYANPKDEGDIASVAEIRYDNMLTYSMAVSWEFRFFLGLILLIWYINLLNEVQAIIRLLDFTWHVPVEVVNPFQWSASRTARRGSRASVPTVRMMDSPESHSADEEEDGGFMASTSSMTPTASRIIPLSMHRTASMASSLAVGQVRTPRTPRNKDGEIVVNSITRPHWAMCMVMVVIRTTLVVYMSVAGTVFVLTTYSYPDLLMNAVALAFVFELPALFYDLLVGDEDKQVVSQFAPISHKTFLPLTDSTAGFFLTNFFWGCFVFPLLTFAIIQWNYHVNSKPVYQALECLCLQEGDSCVAASYLTQPWWDAYWARSAWLLASPTPG